MFGGRGFYVDGLFMALIADGQFFLKTDDVNREHFVAAGCVPFSFSTKDGERIVMSYFRAPEEALESPPLMLPWARLAFEAALRAANAKAKKPAAKKSKAVAERAAPSAAKKSAAKKAATKRSTAGRG
ncbi:MULTISPECIES: TfoX/Sxy family protein [unclassified Roseateles]|uniref:TfoX/Sxy family protein n=1 Tax=unclassified Roseateles TaxID=2626991 RepID=UPI001F339061